MEPAVTPCERSLNTLVGEAFASADYCDAFEVDVGSGGDVANFATAFFVSQPRWLA